MSEAFIFPPDAIELVCEWIEEDDLPRKEIAARLGCGKTTLQNWLLSDPVRTARIRAAEQESAATIYRRAGLVIDEIPDNGTPAQVARAREKRQHLEKLAGIRNHAYSERFVVDSNVKIVDPDKMTDADLLRIAVNAGLSGPVIDGFAQVVAQARIVSAEGAD